MSRIYDYRIREVTRRRAEPVSLGDRRNSVTLLAISAALSVVALMPPRISWHLVAVEARDVVALFGRVIVLSSPVGRDACAVSLQPLCLAGLMCLATPEFAAAAETRMALVIGNSTYQHLPARKTAVDDAKAIGTMLSSAGFAVTSASNVTDAEMRRHVREFAAAVAASGPDTVALVFFAGHGLQVEERDYLLPVDAREKTARDARALEVPALENLESILASSQRRMLIVMIDASRSNPFRPRSARARPELDRRRPTRGKLRGLRDGAGTGAGREQRPARLLYDGDPGGDEGARAHHRAGIQEGAGARQRAVGWPSGSVGELVDHAKLLVLPRRPSALAGVPLGSDLAPDRFSGRS